MGKTFRTTIRQQTKHLFYRQKHFNTNIAVLLRTSAFYRMSPRFLVFQRRFVEPQCNISSFNQGVIVRHPIAPDAGFAHLGGLLYIRGSCTGSTLHTLQAT